MCATTGCEIDKIAGINEKHQRCNASVRATSTVTAAEFTNEQLVTEA